MTVVTSTAATSLPQTNGLPLGLNLGLPSVSGALQNTQNHSAAAQAQQIAHHAALSQSHAQGQSHAPNQNQQNHQQTGSVVRTPQHHPVPPTSSTGAGQPQAQPGQSGRRAEIYKFVSPKPVYASAWSPKMSDKFRLAVGTVVERDQGNRITIVQLDDNQQELIEKSSVGVEFPANAICFIPDSEGSYPDLLASSSDYVRLWKITNDTIVEEAVLSSAKSSQYMAPLTSFDWNEVDNRMIGTASIDTTCTIYDIEVGQAVGITRGTTTFQVKTQLIAHDKPVHDIGFSKVHNGKDHFATVGADGSARMFDLRNLEHSTIVYEEPAKQPLMRLAWNKAEPFHLATFAMDSNEVVIVDIRMPCNPIARLKNHTAAVNGMAWAPHSANHICTAGDDTQALIWDLHSVPRPVDDPILAYSAGGEVNQVHWSSSNSNWICICFNKTLEILRV